jgi:hypothetical protein
MFGALACAKSETDIGYKPANAKPDDNSAFKASRPNSQGTFYQG